MSQVGPVGRQIPGCVQQTVCCCLLSIHPGVSSISPKVGRARYVTWPIMKAVRGGKGGGGQRVVRGRVQPNISTDVRAKRQKVLRGDEYANEHARICTVTPFVDRWRGHENFHLIFSCIGKESVFCTKHNSRLLFFLSLWPSYVTTFCLHHRMMIFLREYLFDSNLWLQAKICFSSATHPRS